MERWEIVLQVSYLPVEQGSSLCRVVMKLQKMVKASDRGHSGVTVCGNELQYEKRPPKGSCACERCMTHPWTYDGLQKIR